MKKYVYILSFLELFSFGLVLPVLGPQIIALGGDRILLGILGSMQSLLQFITGPIFGSWSDNVGAKPALLVTAYGLLASQLIFSVPNLYCYIIGRIINACFFHGQILVRTLLTESKEQDQAGVQGKLRAFGALSFTFAPIIGGVIVGREHGFSQLSMLCCFLSVINIAICHLLPAPPKKQQQDASKKVKLSAMQQIIANLKQVDWNIFGTLFTFRFLVEMAAAIYHTSLGFVFSQVFKSTPSEVGLIISFYGVCSIIINISMKTIRERFPDGYKYGTVGMLMSFGMIYMFPYFWTYIAFIVLFSIFKTLLEASWTDTIISMTDDKNNGAVNGAFQSLVQLAGFVAPLLNGYIGQQYGHSSTIMTCVIIACISVGVSRKLRTVNVVNDGKDNEKEKQKTQ